MFIIIRHRCLDKNTTFSIEGKYDRRTIAIQEAEAKARSLADSTELEFNDEEIGEESYYEPIYSKDSIKHFFVGNSTINYTYTVVEI